MSDTKRNTAAGIALSVAAAVVSAAVLVATGSRAPDAREAAGVFPPWWGRSAVIAAAGQAGAIRDLGAVPFIVVVRDPGGQAARRLREAGALFTVAPAGAAICIS